MSPSAVIVNNIAAHRSLGQLNVFQAVYPKASLSFCCFHVPMDMRCLCGSLQVSVEGDVKRIYLCMSNFVFACTKKTGKFMAVIGIRCPAALNCFQLPWLLYEEMCVHHSVKRFFNFGLFTTNSFEMETRHFKESLCMRTNIVALYATTEWMQCNSCQTLNLITPHQLHGPKVVSPRTLPIYQRLIS